MKKSVVAIVIAAASVLSLAGCGGTAATDNVCKQAYIKEKAVAAEYRHVITFENSQLSQYTEGTLSEDDMAADLSVLSDKMKTLAQQEANIPGDLCTGD